MVERDGLPIAFTVAGFASLPVAAFVLVLLLVAGVTVRGRIFKRRREMAFLAFYGGVPAYQRKTRLIVVEGRFLPRPVIVAFLAFSPFLALMLVVLLVAAVTIHRSVLVAFIRMALLARHLDMFVAEPVARLVVVEADVLPVPVRMAVGAREAEVPLMFVVLLVAAVAI